MPVHREVYSWDYFRGSSFCFNGKFLEGGTTKYQTSIFVHYFVINFSALYDNWQQKLASQALKVFLRFAGFLVLLDDEARPFEEPFLFVVWPEAPPRATVDMPRLDPFVR